MKRNQIQNRNLADGAAPPLVEAKKDAALHPQVGNPQVEHGVAQGKTPLRKPDDASKCRFCKGGSCPCRPRAAAGVRVRRLHADEVTPFELVEQLEKTGAAIIKGLPNAEAACRWAKRMTGCRVMRQPQGSLFTDVKPERAFAHLSDAKSRAPLPPHSDGSNEIIPPAVVGLYCVRQSATPEATCVCSIREFMRRACTAEERRWMQTKPKRWSHSFETMGRKPVEASVCAVIAGRQVFRWSTNLLLKGESSPSVHGSGNGFVPDSMVVGLVKKLEAFAAEAGQTAAACAETGDLILIENRTRVHFRGELVSEDRFFKRFWLA